MPVRRRSHAKSLQPVIQRTVEEVVSRTPSVSVVPNSAISEESLYRELVLWKSREARETIEEFAATHGVPVETLKALAQRPSFADDCLREAIAWGKTQIPTMVRIMHNAAMETQSSTEAQRFVETISEISKDRDKIVANQTQVNIFANIDDEKFARIAQRFIKDIPNTSS